ncbi:MAG: HisA/HisF-related TIM barrel protein, partial [Acidimicrobiia bacterium]
VSEVIPLEADPVARARGWEEKGADMLHVVDLDAAIHRDYRNRPLIYRIIGAVGIPVEVAGGVRSEQEVARLIEAGAWRVAMGTAAIENQNMVWETCRDFAGRIAVSLDVTPDEEVVIAGWTAHSGRYLEEVLLEMSSAGVAAFLVARAYRDALVDPPGYQLLQESLATVEEPVIAAGGVRNLDDLRQLMRLEAAGRRLAGVIVGREVTAGRFTIAEAKALLAGEAPPSAPGRVVGLRALLRVSDFKRSVGFYENTLGFRRLTAWDRAHGSGAVLEASNGETLELLGPPPGTAAVSPSGVELGFFVADVQGWHDHLAARGVLVSRELRKEAWGDVVFGIDDPDGVRIWFGQRA